MEKSRTNQTKIKDVIKLKKKIRDNNLVIAKADKENTIKILEKASV